MAKRKDTVTIDLEKPPVEAKPQQPAQSLPVESRPEPQQEPQDQGPDLAEQVERLEAERQQAQAKAMQAEALRQQQAVQVQAWAQQQQFQTEQAQYDSVANALAATQGEADSAQVALEQAWAVGDHRAAAEAQRRLAKAESRISTLEAGRDELQRVIEWRRANPQAAQAQQPQPQQQQLYGVEQVLATMPNLTQKERDWIREHPDSVTDPRQVLRLQAAYVDAEQRGIRRGSADYFAFFEERLGYDKDEGEEVEERRPVQVAAPVSRSAPGVSSARLPRNDRYIDLTPEQQEHARISGVTEFDYAKGLKRLRESKRNGLLQE